MTDYDADKCRQVVERRSVPVPESGCWLWLGAVRANGYGDSTAVRVPHVASRAAWVGYRGQIPDGMLVCHKCDTRCCVNPDHLFLGTGKDNMIDCSKKGRHWASTRPEVAARGERHGSAKLKESDVVRIRALRRTGATYQAIADLYGVTKQTIYQICRWKVWKFVEECAG